MVEPIAWTKRTIVSGVLLLLLGVWVLRMKAPELALFLVQTQDVPVLGLLGISAIAMALFSPRWRLPSSLPPAWLLLLCGCVLVSLLAWGTYALMGNFPLCRDEHMVVFDMAVFDGGHLAAPVPPAWRPFVHAMVPTFLLNANEPSGLVSAYLPMNALLRLAFSKLTDPVWFNPLLALVGAAALLDIARRIFGPDERACWVVLLVYTLSAQVLVTAMTTYAMTAHLALNLIWLAAFLRGGRAGHSIAIVTGFVATGLHQLVFHPLFVAPFLLWRLREGQWRLVLGYAVAYAAIVLWWAAYPLIVSPLVAGPHGRSTAANIITDRLIPLLRMRDPRMIALMLLNLLRFVSWQNFVLIPLVITAIPVVWRDRGFAAALSLGILLWLIFIAVILPEQGRGYGYRYLHGYIGSFALLAGYGYRELEQRIGRPADGMVIAMSGVTLVAAIPLLLIETSRFLQPHLAMQRMIAAQRTPIILIDDEPAPSTDGNWADSALDHVRNLPSTTARPLRFSAQLVTPDMVARLCKIGPVTLITKADMHRVGFILNVSERSPKFEALVAAGEREAPGCLRNVVTPPVSAS